MGLIDQFISYSELVGNVNTVISAAKIQQVLAKKGVKKRYVKADRFGLEPQQPEIDEKGIDEAVVEADYGIAETGTLVFSSRADSPTLFNYLGLHHIVLVEGATLLRYMEDYWSVVRAGGNVHPRNINFITGTSGTADIEAKNTRGAHGPRFLHIVIVGDDSTGQ